MSFLKKKTNFMYSSTNKWLSLVLRWRMLNRFWMTKILTWKWLLIVANFCKRNWRYFMILRWQWRSEQLIFLFFLIRISSRYKEKSRQYDNWKLKKNCHSPAKISYHESKIKKCHGAQNIVLRLLMSADTEGRKWCGPVV